MVNRVSVRLYPPVLTLLLHNSVDSNMTDIDEPEPTRFGDSRTEFIPIIKEFYDRFCNFSTLKSYRWHDKYRLSDAPDRRIRRLMEKENKKLRDVAKREFNDCVRNLGKRVGLVGEERVSESTAMHFLNVHTSRFCQEA